MGAPAQDPDIRVQGLKNAFRRPLSFPTRLGFVCFALVAVFFGALGSRIGTDLARGVAAAVTLLSIFAVWFFLRRRDRQWKRPKHALYRAVASVDPREAERAVRAYSLWKRLEAGDDTGESPELARLHVSRVLDGVSTDKVSQAAARGRRGRLWLATALGGIGLSLAFLRPLLLIEGFDVWLAQNGVGPYPISYISGIAVTAEWPDYLDGTGKKRLVSSRLTQVPQGAEVEVRVIPRIEERELLLTDGNSEVPFLSDGRGGLVARWKAENPTGLRVAARFGDVLLYDTYEARLSPLDDRAPQVMLSEAPKELKLEDIESLSLDFMATDDHGLTQVEVVLQSGQRSSRIEIASLDGQTKIYRGGHTLTREHELLRRAFLPVRVSVEARDGNTATGPSWGKSKEIVLLPEPLGKEVGQRHLAFRAFRSALARYLAEDIRAGHLTTHLAEEAMEAAHAELKEALGTLRSELEDAGQIPASSLAFIDAQLESLKKKGSEKATPESVLLAVDALIQNVAAKEARSLSKSLGSAVEEIAVQTRELRFEAKGISLAGLQDLLRGAQEGAAQLAEVGPLGLDLGSVAKADLARIEKSLEKKSYGRAEAAALHLAERLKRATPSFSSSGGAGVESGAPQPGKGSGQGSGAAGPASDAPAEFQDLAQQVDGLAQETAGELSQLERMLRDAAQAAEADFETKPELKEATNELREALNALPQQAQGPSDPRAEAATARQLGEAMADAVDAGDIVEAIERGVDAREALEQALQAAESPGSWVNPNHVKDAQEALEDLIEQAKKAAEELDKRSRDKMAGSLEERAERQKEFADRAEKLAKKAREPGAPLPGQSIEALERASKLLKDAARALQSGRSEAGVDYAEEAQSELERALPEPQSTSEGKGAPGEGNQEPSDGHVPEEERDRARDFRERVEKGLGRGAGRLSPAVRRYAEELK